MDVGNVRMRARKRCVPVRMRVRFARWIARHVFVSVVLIVHVLVLDGLVRVHVLVFRPQKHRHAGGHGHERDESMARGRSPRIGIAAMAPMNGAVAKNAASRAAPM